MGSTWTMFTKTQSQELVNNTNNIWTTINGVNGRKFTSNTDSSKYIFLPAGGSWYRTSNYDKGSRGYYWGGTIQSTSTQSNALFIIYSNDSLGIDFIDRSYGMSVRAI